VSDGSGSNAEEDTFPVSRDHSESALALRDDDEYNGDSDGGRSSTSRLSYRSGTGSKRSRGALKGPVSSNLPISEDSFMCSGCGSIGKKLGSTWGNHKGKCAKSVVKRTLPWGVVAWRKLYDGQQWQEARTWCKMHYMEWADWEEVTGMAVPTTAAARAAGGGSGVGSGGQDKKLHS
jgi:hypothetical protein